MTSITLSTQSISGRPFDGLRWHLESLKRVWSIDRVVLVSDHPSPVEGVERIDFDWTERARMWVDRYRHKSPNGEHFERFCFVRWLFLKQAMLKLGVTQAWTFDGDLLVFDPASPCVTSGTSFITNMGKLEYRIGRLEEALLHPDSCPVPHVSDMWVVRHYEGDIMPEGMDRNLYLDEGTAMVRKHKLVMAVRGSPYFVKPGGGFISARTMHCWGPAKAAMGSIYEQIVGSGDEPKEVMW
jgi:hypothetical protein